MWIILAGVAALAFGAYFLETTAMPPKLIAVGPNFSLIRNLAGKWGRIFSVPVPMTLVICQIESAFHPDAVNNTGPDAGRGGAWGVAQMTLKTAIGVVDQIRKSSHVSNGDVALTLAKWDGTGQSLLDPDLCLLLAVWMLSGLWIKYRGDYRAVAGAYNQGAGKIDSILKGGGSLPDSLPPGGKSYVSKAMAYWPTYQQYA